MDRWAEIAFKSQICFKFKHFELSNLHTSHSSNSKQLHVQLVRWYQLVSWIWGYFSLRKNLKIWPRGVANIRCRPAHVLQQQHTRRRPGRSNRHDDSPVDSYAIRFAFLWCLTMDSTLCTQADTPTYTFKAHTLSLSLSLSLCVFSTNW